MPQCVAGAEGLFPRILLCVIKVWNYMTKNLRDLKELKELDQKVPARAENGRKCGCIGGIQKSRRIVRWKAAFVKRAATVNDRARSVGDRKNDIYTVSATNCCLGRKMETSGVRLESLK